MTSTPSSEAQIVTRDITRLAVGVAVVLIVLKAFALGASGSVSILASLADSTLDLVASLATFFAVRWAAAPADDDHRYGHGKGEALAALVQSGLVFASAVFIGLEAVQRMFDPQPVTSGVAGVVVMLISIGLTGWLIWMQSRAMRRSGSLAVAADRAHYASDLAANGVVLIGVISGSLPVGARAGCGGGAGGVGLAVLGRDRHSEKRVRSSAGPCRARGSAQGHRRRRPVRSAHLGPASVADPDGRAPC